MLFRMCILCLGAPFLFAACGLNPNEPQPQVSDMPSGAEASSPEALPRVDASSMTDAGAEAEPRSAIARHSVEHDVRQLLKGAEAALAADRLTTPLHDNAFDRYQAVLLLRPDNQQARSGLEQVFSRYVTMIRRALARNQPGAARALVERAKLVDRDHPMLAELSAEITAMQQGLAAQGGGDAEKEILLDAQNLDRRDETTVETLKKLAMDIKKSEDTLLIVARNDAEGRWIYQQMSEGVPNYRLRGDIRLGRVPKILLLPPIE